MKRSIGSKTILLGVLLLVVSAIVILSRPSQPTWRLAQAIAPADLLTQVVQDNVNPETPVDPSQMSVLKVRQSRQSQPLYVIDARLDQAESQPLCGAAGCAFFGYIPHQAGFQRVFAAYLNPHLPPEHALIQPGKTLDNGLPTLAVNQLEGSILQHLTLAFDGQHYAIAQLDNLPLANE